MMAALTTIAFAEAARLERGDVAVPAAPWLFSRRMGIVLAIPFLLVGKWPLYLGLMAFYAAASFFLIQHIRHGLGQSGQR